MFRLARPIVISRSAERTAFLDVEQESLLANQNTGTLERYEQYVPEEDEVEQQDALYQRKSSHDSAMDEIAAQDSSSEDEASLPTDQVASPTVTPALKPPVETISSNAAGDSLTGSPPVDIREDLASLLVQPNNEPLLPQPPFSSAATEVANILPLQASSAIESDSALPIVEKIADESVSSVRSITSSLPAAPSTSAVPLPVIVSTLSQPEELRTQTSSLELRTEEDALSELIYAEQARKQAEPKSSSPSALEQAEEVNVILDVARPSTPILSSPPITQASPASPLSEIGEQTIVQLDDLNSEEELSPVRSRHYPITAAALSTLDEASVASKENHDPFSTIRPKTLFPRSSTGNFPRLNRSTSNSSLMSNTSSNMSGLSYTLKLQQQKAQKRPTILGRSSSIGLNLTLNKAEEDAFYQKPDVACLADFEEEEEQNEVD